MSSKTSSRELSMDLLYMKSNALKRRWMKSSPTSMPNLTLPARSKMQTVRPLLALRKLFQEHLLRLPQLHLHFFFFAPCGAVSGGPARACSVHTRGRRLVPRVLLSKGEPQRNHQNSRLEKRTRTQHGRVCREVHQASNHTLHGWTLPCTTDCFHARY